DRLNTALLLEGLCRLAAAESNWSLALRLGGAAAGLREAAGAQSIPLWQDRVDEACQKALTNLGQEAGTAVFEGGRSLEYIEAVSLARGSGESREAARSGCCRPAHDRSARLAPLASAEGCSVRFRQHALLQPRRRRHLGRSGRRACDRRTGV